MDFCGLLDVVVLFLLGSFVGEEKEERRRRRREMVGSTREKPREDATRRIAFSFLLIFFLFLFFGFVFSDGGICFEIEELRYWEV